MKSCKYYFDTEAKKWGILTV